jgi:excisionase family DNA binding protein
MINYYNEDPLKCLSVNAASKRLKIRSETVLQLISEGKIGFIKMNNRYKIPVASLIKFIEGAEENKIEETKKNRIEEVKFSFNKKDYIKKKVDEIIKKYSKRI